MKRSSLMGIVRVAIAFALAFGIYVSSSAAAEVEARDKTLQKTWIKTQDKILPLVNANIDGFSPTKIICESRECTVRVEVSAQFQDHFVPPAGPQTLIRMRLLIDGSTAGIAPTAVIQADASGEPLAHVRTFAWLTTVDQGSHEVKVQFHTNGGDANARYRILTIEVYK